MKLEFNETLVLHFSTVGGTIRIADVCMCVRASSSEAAKAAWKANCGLYMALACVWMVCALVAASVGGNVWHTAIHFTHKIWNNYSFVAVCLLRYSGILQRTTVVWCLYMCACVFSIAWIEWSKEVWSGEYSLKVTIRFTATAYLHGIGALRNTLILISRYNLPLRVVHISMVNIILTMVLSIVRNHGSTKRHALIITVRFLMFATFVAHQRQWAWIQNEWLEVSQDKRHAILLCCAYLILLRGLKLAASFSCASTSDGISFMKRTLLAFSSLRDITFAADPLAFFVCFRSESAASFFNSTFNST